MKSKQEMFLKALHPFEQSVEISTDPQSVVSGPKGVIVYPLSKNKNI